jgi:death-on-curing protein
VAEISRLTEDEVLAIRRRMGSLDIATRDAFGHIEPLDPGKLSSAVYRQYTSGGGIYKYTAIHDVGANVFYGVAMSHAFENGNKRTALVSLLVFLDKNKTLLANATEDDLYDLARQVAAHEIQISPNTQRNSESEVKAVAKWLREHVRPKVLGDNATDYKELRDILEELGCEFDSPDQNFVKIRRLEWSVKTGYPRANFTVPVQEVKRIRRALHLDELHGVDSAGFYNLEETVDGFVNQYRNLMKRLADL